MDSFYARCSPDRQALIDKIVATATSYEMDLAREALSSITRGHYFNHAEYADESKIAILFLGGTPDPDAEWVQSRLSKENIHAA